MDWFALATYNDDSERAGGSSAALVLDDCLYDLVSVFTQLQPGQAPLWCEDLNLLLANWEALSGELEQLANGARELIAAGSLEAVDNGLSRLQAPLMPGRVFGTASNYHEHAAEMETELAAKADSSPYIFMKASTAVIGPGQTVLIPPETEKPDWEVELAVILGRAGRRISVDNAFDYIAGYTVVNDVSARDMNRRTDYPFKHDWFRGKSWDTFCPLGPWFVPRDCIADLHNLKLGLTLNGKVMQDGNTSELIWNVFEQIAYVSSLVTVQPGDLIMTGTPAGVGMGRGVFLKPGDEMVAGIEGVGELKNPVAAEQV